MKNKIYLMIFGYICIFALFFGGNMNFVEAGILPVPYTSQVVDGQWLPWCWAASARSILSYYGFNMNTCDIVSWAKGSDCCPNTCNFKMPLCHDSGTKGALKYFSNSMLNSLDCYAPNSYYNTDSGLAEIINKGIPIPFSPNNDHTQTIIGYIKGDTQSQSILYYTDSNLSLNWHPSLMDYNYYKNNLFQSLVIHSSGAGMPATDVKVNGLNGPAIYTSGNYLSINVKLYNNGSSYSGDWWIVFINGSTTYYRKPNGMLTTTPYPWRQSSLINYNSTFNTTLANGEWYIGFAVDRYPDGVMNNDTLYYDYVWVDIN